MSGGRLFAPAVEPLKTASQPNLPRKRFRKNRPTMRNEVKDMTPRKIKKMSNTPG